ncbi:MAG: hypothetical protein Q8O19_04430 [Rectinemataceae bacterium]|nr:hypothetical protein [Rectinemataceae bacterium]
MARVAKIAKTTIETTPAPVVSKQGRILSVIIVLAVLLCLSIGIAGYFYYQYTYSPQKNPESEIKTLIGSIGKFMDLPEEEEPTLATVTDKEKLSGQPFFQKAENGDKVLIYTNSGRAILYRPSTGKIVDVTTVNVNTPAPVVAPADVPATAPQTDETAVSPVSQAVNVKVALYNGSTKIGVTNTFEEEMKAKFPDAKVVTKEKAAKNDYRGTLVIDLSGKNADLAKGIAENFAGTVGTLPVGETTPAADILVIVGNK